MAKAASWGRTSSSAVRARSRLHHTLRQLSPPRRAPLRRAHQERRAGHSGMTQPTGRPLRRLRQIERQLRRLDRVAERTLSGVSAAQTRPLAARQVHESRGDQTASEHSSERSTRPTVVSASLPTRSRRPVRCSSTLGLESRWWWTAAPTRRVPRPLERGAECTSSRRAINGASWSAFHFQPRRR